MLEDAEEAAVVLRVVRVPDVAAVVLRVMRVPDVVAGTGGAAAFFLPFDFLEGLDPCAGSREDGEDGDSMGEVDSGTALDLGIRGSLPLFQAASSSGVAIW